MMYFRPRPGVLDERFLVHSIYGPVVRRYIEHACNGSTVGHLRLGQVAAIPLLWCPLVEQLNIVEHIEREAAPLELAITQAEREIALIREYRTRLIADVVTGQLDVRAAAARLPASDPDEPTPADLDDDATDDDLDQGEPE
jgi:type I restriction enzyme, S subunit